MGTLIGVGVCAVLAIVIVIVGKNDQKECQEFVSRLTGQQVDFLKGTDPQFVEKDAWVQDAIVAKMTDKGNKISLRLLWYNTVLQNNEYQKITIADTSISASEQQSHNLKVGDSVKMYFAPEKTVGSVKVVW